MKVKILGKPERLTRNEWTQTLRVQKIEVDLEYSGYSVVAIDPGVNFGMTIFDSYGLRVYNGKLLKQERSLNYAWMAFSFIREVLIEQTEDPLVAIEGAAFHKIYGQVGLADVRAGFYLGAYLSHPGRILVPAPMSVRKRVFGDGKTQAGNVFPQLNHNAADSLAIAAWAMDTPLQADTSD